MTLAAIKKQITNFDFCHVASKKTERMQDTKSIAQSTAAFCFKVQIANEFTNPSTVVFKEEMPNALAFKEMPSRDMRKGSCRNVKASISNEI